MSDGFPQSGSQIAFQRMHLVVKIAERKRLERGISYKIGELKLCLLISYVSDCTSSIEIWRLFFGYYAFHPPLYLDHFCQCIVPAAQVALIHM